MAKQPDTLGPATAAPKKSNIKMIGYQSNPFPWIIASNVGIMPSKYEGFGLTAIEATILNKKVLNSGVGGLSYIYRNN